MSSVGAARSEDYVYQAQETITVSTGGIVDKKDVYILPRGVVKFTNSVGTEFVIQFLVRGQDPANPNALRSDVDLFLPAFDSRTLVAGQGLAKGECKYRILPVLADSIGVKTIVREIEETSSGSEEQTVESVAVEFDVVSNAGKAGGGGTIHIGS